MPATLWAPRLSRNDDVAWLQGRHQDLFDVGAEALAIDRAVEDPRCGQPRDKGNAAETTCWSASVRRGRGRGRARHAVQRPYRRSRLLVMPVSVQKHEVGDVNQVGAAACHATRAAATSGRSCSDGRTVFFNGQAKGPSRRARPSAHSRAWRGRPSAQPAYDPGAPQSARPRCAGAARACSAVHVAGREAPPRPFRAAAVSVAAPTTRSRGTSPLTSAAFIPASLSSSTRSRRSIE